MKNSSLIIFTAAIALCFQGCATPPPNSRQEVMKFPILGDLPLVGVLFRKTVTVPEDSPSPAPAVPSQTKALALSPVTWDLDPEDLERVTGYGSTAAILTFDARGGLSTDEAALLSDRFSIELDNCGVYRLISRSKMTEILELQKFSLQDSCTANECAVEAGQILGVRYMIYGSIGKIGSLYTLNSYLVSVEKGVTEASATTDVSGGIEDLLIKGMPHNVQKLLRATMR